MNTIEFQGRQFLVTLESDGDLNEPPWECEDGHVHLERVPHDYGTQYGRVKKPGEQMAYRGNSREYSYCFNMSFAMDKALSEQWGIDDKTLARFTADHGRPPSKREIAVMAIDADIERMRGWIVGDWEYIGVCVRIIGADGKPEGDDYGHALWGVESDGDYWREIAQDLAGDILHERGTAWRAALREARERSYWASRDVETTA